MKKSTLQITTIFFLSTIIQVVSNIVLTRLFGTSLDYTHFLAAVTIPTIIVTVIYGTLNDALLPIYGEKLINEKEKSNDFFYSQLTTITLLSILLTLVGNMLATPAMSILYKNTVLFIPYVVNMLRIMNLAIPFAVFVTILGMRFYAHKRYLRFPLAQLIGSIANLVVVLILYDRHGAMGVVYSFVIGIIIQLFLVFPKDISFNIGNISPTLSLWIPLIVGITALKSDSLIIRTFSAQLPDGYIVYHNLISKVCSLSAGLLTIGMQVIFLPNIIEKLAKKDYKETLLLVNKVKLVSICLSVMLVASIYFVAPFLIKILFVGGRFTMDDFNVTSSLIPYYLIPVFGWGIVSIFLQPLYALKKHLIVGIVNLLCFGLAWIAAVSFSRNSPSLAISISLSILLLGSVIGSEIVWRYYLNKLSISK